MNVSPVGQRLPGSPVHIILGVVSEDVTHLLLEFGVPLLVKLKGLHVLVNLRKSREAEKASAHVSVCNSPGEGKLRLSVSKFSCKSAQGSKCCHGLLLSVGSKVLAKNESQLLVVGIS